jgi:hypothetical protein
MRVGFQDHRPRSVSVTDVAFAGAAGSVTVRAVPGGRTSSLIVGAVVVAAAAETIGAVALASRFAGGAAAGAVAWEALQGTQAMIRAPTEVRARRRALERWVGAPVACLPVMGLLVVFCAAKVGARGASGRGGRWPHERPHPRRH